MALLWNVVPYYVSWKSEASYLNAIDLQYKFAKQMIEIISFGKHLSSIAPIVALLSTMKGELWIVQN